MSGARLPKGGRIDRGRPLSFRFEGKAYSGFEGDTLASALLANGVQLTGRSFKYHRPRGIVGAGFEEPASLVELSGVDEGANQPVTTVRLREGLDARAVNCWPSASFDLMAVNQAFAPLLPAAFYYKTFMWPTWHLFEPAIRRAAGLAAAPSQPPAGRYEVRHDHCDVLVVGAGPAGLAAALTAGRSGARVLLVDAGVEPGGSLLACPAVIDGLPAAAWTAGMLEELDALPNVRRLADTLAWGYREHNLVMLTERDPAPGMLQRSRRVRAGQVVLATGAIERMLVFQDNDRPGVMLASAARSYLHRYGVRAGRRAVIFTNNDSAYGAARDLAAAGMEIAAVVDSREGGTAALDLLAPGVPILAGHVVCRALGGRGVKGVIVRPRGGGATRRIDCDLLCISGGWTPTVHLFSQSRGTLRYDDAIAAFRPDRAVEPTRAAGAANGMFGLAAVLADGATAGQAAALATGRPASVGIPPIVASDEGYAIEPLWHVEPDSASAKCFVDLQNDVTLADLRLAHREGFGAIEHAKRYTTAGMGFDQGKTGNMNVVGILAGESGTAPGAIGTTTFRAPFAPVEFGAVAGAREGSVLLPYRHTPMTAWHRANGAVMYEAGARWRRPGYYPRAGETLDEAVQRECRAVRNGVGVYDGSPLGKFEIAGPDALALLQMVYTNAFDTLQNGQGRYGLMLSDDGLIFDDGVTFRLGQDRYLMTTSTGNADAVHSRLEEYVQLERPDWRVYITPVTTQWCNATICGPRARDLLTALGTDIAIANAAFSFMELRTGTVAGLPARVCRVSFTGELSYEINVAARHGAALWERIMAAGGAFGIEPVGSEANHVLRVEKGFLSLGHEADATADAHDLGMGWIMSRRKADYIGRRAVEIRRSSGMPRRELVGLLPDDPDRLITEGAPLTPGGVRTKSEGLVTACVRSVVHGRSIALALLENGRARIGGTAHARLMGEIVPARIVAPCFHDPEGHLLRS